MAAADRRNNFTNLRLAAALLVVVSHSYGICNKGVEQPVFYIGRLMVIPSTIGMITFFVSSGYLIMQSLERSSSSIQYLKKRVLRIYPALIVCNILCVVVLGLFFCAIPFYKYIQLKQTWAYLFWNTVLIKNQFYLPGVFETLKPDNEVNSSLWTLGVEVFLYFLLLVLSLIGLFKTNTRFVTTFVIVAILCLAGQAIVIDGWGLKPYCDLTLLFFTGAFLHKLNSKIPWKWYWLLLLYICVTVIKQPALQWAFTVALCSYFIIGVATKLPAVMLSNVDISYGVYIYAFPVQQCLLIMLGKNVSPFLHIGLSLLLVVPLAWFSWTLIERPALRLKKTI